MPCQAATQRPRPHLGRTTLNEDSKRSSPASGCAADALDQGPSFPAHCTGPVETGSVLWRFSAVTLLPSAENPGKQVGAPLPQKTPRKVLGDLKNSSSTQNSARKPSALGTPKQAFVPARDSTSKQKERVRGGRVSSAHKVAPQRPANELLSELEHMAPPEPGEGLQDGIGGRACTH